MINATEKYDFYVSYAQVTKKVSKYFVFDRFSPCIIQPSNDYCSYDIKYPNKNLNNDSPTSWTASVRITESTPEVKPCKVIVGYRTPPNFLVSPPM